eukprot:CAMPEP_0119544182 /NCGR_PEP_ID=MMETSP1344-20130328/54577_1 /TAXON_ID=236787 /ORGANISM="Florenciella parvula, Strain CCMP2471" /LENGTH=181 /DNA_ID=CAMNT_0007588635 /DNA_START=74 /DNA_END=620 /DNA_ORIENTATION=-
MSALLASARQNLLGEEPEEKSAMEEMEEACCGACPKLTWKQKMIGCATCMFIGCIIEFGSFFRFMNLVEGDPAPFAEMYTLGNVVALSGTFFLMGAKKQCRQMFHKTRRLATVVFLVTMVLTLFLAFFRPSCDECIPGRVPLLILCICLQTLALFWYTIIISRLRATASSARASGHAIAVT